MAKVEFEFPDQSVSDEQLIEDFSSAVVSPFTELMKKWGISELVYLTQEDLSELTQGEIAWGAIRLRNDEDGDPSFFMSFYSNGTAKIQTQKYLDNKWEEEEKTASWAEILSEIFKIIREEYFLDPAVMKAAKKVVMDEDASSDTRCQARA